MCKAIDDMKRESWNAGYAIGYAEGRTDTDQRIVAIIKVVMRTLSLTAQQAIEFLEMSDDDRSKY